MFSFFKKDIPDFITNLIPKEKTLYSDNLMKLAVDIAIENAKRGGGPFGAVIANGNGTIVTVGYNNVIDQCDSTAHAEINAIRRAEKKLGTHDLSQYDLILYSSCEPCIQCFGAIYWSGIKEIYSAATREDAEAVGFDECPKYFLARDSTILHIGDFLWKVAKDNKKLQHIPKFGRTKRALEPFKIYQKLGKKY
jgi:guanine deaminase